MYYSEWMQVQTLAKVMLKVKARMNFVINIDQLKYRKDL